MQAKEWGQFQESLGRRVFWVDEVLLIEMPLPLGQAYLYAPRCSGRVFEKDFLAELLKIRQSKHIFFRVEPEIQNSEFIIHNPKFKRLSFSVQPQKTLILNLQKPEEELLGEMHHKTRYNIHLAERHGVKIKMGQEYFDEFWKLMKETAQRDKIKIFSRDYYKKQLIVSDNFKNELWVAEYEREIMAGNIVNFYGNTATYLHGASADKFRNLMSTYLLQWEQIKEAKKRGLQSYDFWGFDEKLWPGVSRFKKGFGGEVVEYAGAHDLVWKKMWYQLYELVKKFL